MAFPVFLIFLFVFRQKEPTESRFKLFSNEPSISAGFRQQVRTWFNVQHVQQKVLVAFIF